MGLSARCNYACKALLELTSHWPNKEPIPVHIISERQNIPLKYLVQILLQLKGAGLVVSIRGKEGGYALSRSPDSITLGEVMRNTQGPLLPSGNSFLDNASVFTKLWNELEGAIESALDKITFTDISNRAEGQDKVIHCKI